MKDWETATASVVAPLPSSVAVEDSSPSMTPTAIESRKKHEMSIAHEPVTTADHNMVLFVSSDP